MVLHRRETMVRAVSLFKGKAANGTVRAIPASVGNFSMFPPWGSGGGEGANRPSVAPVDSKN